jgi:hypothetical protein
VDVDVAGIQDEVLKQNLLLQHLPVVLLAEICEVDGCIRPLLIFEVPRHQKRLG